jgi:hypothetical protein
MVSLTASEVFPPKLKSGISACLRKRAQSLVDAHSSPHLRHDLPHGRVQCEVRDQISVCVQVYKLYTPKPVLLGCIPKVIALLRREPTPLGDRP